MDGSPLITTTTSWISENGLDPGILELENDNDYDIDVEVDDDDEVFEEEQSEDPPPKPNKDIFIVATVDGTLAAVDSSTGKVLWKQAGKGSESYQRQQHETTTSSLDKNTNDGLKFPLDTAKEELNGKQKHNDNNNNNNKLLQPLITTTTTASSAKMSTASDSYRTAAIPSIDGSVFLTTAESPPGDAKTKRATGSTALTKTNVASLHELVARSPYVDANGLFYVGSRHATAAAVDGDTGEILYVASADNMGGPDGQGNNNNNNNDPTWENRNVVWIGRVDYSVSVYNAKSSVKEVQFSAAEMSP